MFNAEIPSRAELPSTRQLLKSTAIAIVVAAVILLTVVLPAEYGIDPTGVGRALQLTQMGEIKKQLSIEAEADLPRWPTPVTGTTTRWPQASKRTSRSPSPLRAARPTRPWSP
jgi:hypothetical protein